MTVCGVSVLKKVLLVVTRKPRCLASLMAATASSKVPSLATDSSCRSRMPSMCTAKVKYGEGVNLSIFLRSSSALVHRKTYLRRSTSWRTISSICGCISGSPPAIETIGAPDSRTAPTAWATGIRCFRTPAGCWILPQPSQARLQANSGSSSTISGNLSRRLSSFCCMR